MQNIIQAKEFIYFFLIGIIITFIFDIFRAIRKNFKTSDLVTFIEDLIFLSIATIIIMFGILKIASGILRFYIFLGIFLGIITYSLTFSKFCIIIINGIVIFCKKMSYFVKHIFIKFLNLLKKLGKKLQL